MAPADPDLADQRDQRAGPTREKRGMEHPPRPEAERARCTVPTLATTLCHDPRMGVMTQLMAKCILLEQREGRGRVRPGSQSAWGGIAAKEAEGGARPRLLDNIAPISSVRHVLRAHIFRVHAQGIV
jgi:hypothetical protein